MLYRPSLADSVASAVFPTRVERFWLLVVSACIEIVDALLFRLQYLINQEHANCGSLLAVQYARGLANSPHHVVTKLDFARSLHRLSKGKVGVPWTEAVWDSS